jgi:hypothetical protein
MIHRRFTLLFLALILVFLLIFPGVVLAENTESGSNIIKNTFTLVIEAPEQTEAGKTLTLAATVRENTYDEPVAGAKVEFFVRSDLFIKGLVDIGEATTDENGTAKIDYIPNQPGALQIVASYKADISSEPIEANRMVNITGFTKSLYQTVIGIQYPNSFLIWLIALAVILTAVWGIFFFVVYQVQYISRGTGAKGAPFIIIIGVVVLFTVMLLVIVTPEAQYNFGLLP